MIRRTLSFLMVILLIFCCTSIQSFGATFIDRCDSTESSVDVNYSNFYFYPKIDEFFLIESGLGGNCIYSNSAADTPSAIYGVSGAQEVKITFVSANSTSIFSNSKGDLTLGKTGRYQRYHSSDIFVSEQGVAFSGGFALGYNHGYEFKQPISSAKLAYLGVNVSVVDQNGNFILLERKLENVRTVPKIGGGYIFIEDYYWKVPSNCSFVNVTVNGYTKIYDDDVLKTYIQKKPYAIKKIEINGERLQFLSRMEEEEDISNNEGKNKSNSKSKSGADFVVDVESEAYYSSTENVTIYDNDTVNIYGSSPNNNNKQKAEVKKESEFLGKEGDHMSSQREDSVLEMVDAVPSQSSQGQDNTWKLAGGIYIAVTLAMLFTALIVKRPKKQEKN